MYFLVRHEDGSTTLSDDPDEGDQESRANLLMYLEKLSQNLITYKNHRIRTIHDKTLLADQISNLQDWQVLIISDWKMKILYLEYRESMHAFFSKKGIPLHGTLFIRNKIADEYSTQNMDAQKSQTFKVIRKFYL